MMPASRAVGVNVGLAVTILLAAMMLGGSTSNPVYEMSISIVALFCLVVSVWWGRQQSAAWPAVTIIAVILALFIVQLLPLPDVIWSALAQGRFAHSLPAAANVDRMWKTLSIAPDATLYSMTACVPALVMLWLTSKTSQTEKMLLANVFIGASVGSALIGIAQAAKAWSPVLYEFRHQDVAIGLFASRNYFATSMLMAAAILFALRQSWAKRLGQGLAELLFHSALLLFLAAVVGSASRAGVVLFLFVGTAGYALSLKPGSRIRFMAAALIVGVLVWALWQYLPQTGVVKTTAARFELDDDARLEIWRNSLLAAKSYWPWGAGIGTFRLAYEQTEPLISVTPSYINAAHNEYLQLLIEAGAFGLLVALGVSIMIVMFGWRHRHEPLVLFAVLGLLAVGMHSIVDYPFRPTSLNVAIATFCAFVVAPFASRKR